MSAAVGVLVVDGLAWAIAVVAGARARSALAWWAAAAVAVTALALQPDARGASVAGGTVVLTGLLLSLPTGVPSPRRLAVLAVVAVAAAVGVRVEAVRWAAAVGGPALGAAGAVLGLRSQTPLARRRTEAVLLAAAAMVELAVGATVLGFLLGWSGWIAEALLVGSVVLPAAVAVAASPRVGAALDRVLAVVIVGGGLLLLAVLVVAFVLAGLGGRPDGAQREAVALTLAGATVAAAAFPSIHQRLRASANRLVYGAVHSPDQVARGFGARLNRAIPLDELLLQLAETVQRALRAEATEVWVGEDGVYGLGAAVPHVGAEPLRLAPAEVDVVARTAPAGGTWVQLWLPALARRHPVERLRVAPLAHGGRLLGLLVARRATEGDPFDERDDQVLADLARQVAAALHNVALDNALAATVEELRETNARLRASRARVVASGDAERRRIERDLHDGAQQHLVALAVKLRLAQDALADGEGADAADLLAEIRGDLTATIAELRALAHGIYPPLLASGGLAEALPSAAARAALPAEVVACPPARYRQEVETAVYFCCLEALQNAAKHAGPDAGARIEVAEQQGWLRFSIVDDGAGFYGPAPGGQGLTNMADRVGAVGGSLEIEGRPGGGTRVEGRLPLE